MPRKGHTEEQILQALRQAEGGEKATEICRKLGISEQTFYTWKRKYTGLGLSELRELRQLRDENGKLKKLVADLSLDRHMLQEIPCFSKPRHRRVLRWTQLTHQVSERRASRLLLVQRSSLRYESHRDQQEPLRMRLRELAGSRVLFGYRRLTVVMKREGWTVNAKLIYRLYTEEGLTVRIKQRKKAASRQRTIGPSGGGRMSGGAWTGSDWLVNDRWFRVLTVVDQFTRECLLLYADSALSGEKVAAELELSSVTERGVPTSITVDNGSEFTSRARMCGQYGHGIRLDFIRPGRPVENGYIESFNGRLRDECLSVNLFSVSTPERS